MTMVTLTLPLLTHSGNEYMSVPDDRHVDIIAVGHIDGTGLHDVVGVGVSSDSHRCIAIDRR